jgi:hypothetical protein
VPEAIQARPLDAFIIEALADEVLVYDRGQQRAHCLSRAAAELWRACDGMRTRAELAAILEASDPSEDLDRVLLALATAGLLERREAVDTGRRAFVGRAVVAAGVLASPVVFSIVAPSVAEAASVCGTVGAPCCTGDKCNPPLKCNPADKRCGGPN